MQHHFYSNSKSMQKRNRFFPKQKKDDLFFGSMALCSKTSDRTISAGKVRPTYTRGLIGGTLGVVVEKLRIVLEKLSVLEKLRIVLEKRLGLSSKGIARSS
jgi:hypothetical protein